METSKKVKKSKILSLAVIFLLMSVSVFAFRVSPVKFDLTIPRGKSQVLTLNFTGSKGSTVENVTLYPTDISMLRNGNTKFIRRLEFEHSAVPWVSFDRENMRIIGTEKKQFDFEIHVPRNATPGEYYVAIINEPLERSTIKVKDEPLKIQMRSRVAIVIVLNVPGRNYKKEGSILESKVKEENGKINITSTFENEGNIHLDVTGKAIIRSKNGRTSYGEVALRKTGAQPNKKQFVFPKNLLDFHGAINKKLPAGDYVVDISFDYGYDFKKAKDQAFFTVERGAGVKESDMNFISVKPEKLRIALSKGMFRTKTMEISSFYGENMKISTEIEEEWLKISPSTIILRPGQKRTIKVIIKVPDDFEEKLSGKIVFNPEKGKSIEMPVKIMSHQLFKEVKIEEAKEKERKEAQEESKNSFEIEKKQKEKPSDKEKAESLKEDNGSLEVQKKNPQNPSKMKGGEAKEKEVKERSNDYTFFILVGLMLIALFLLIVLLKKIVASKRKEK